MERLVRLQLLNQEFSFQTNLSDGELEEIVALVRQEIGALDEPRVQAVPTGKTLVLVCLQLAARVVALRREQEAYRQRQESRIDGIIDRVSATMGQND